MMKIYLNILLLFFGTLCFSQDQLKATYQVNTKGLTKTEILLFNESNSIYFTNVKKKERAVLKDDSKTFFFNIKNIFSSRYYQEKSSEVIKFERDKTLVSDSLYFVKWTDYEKPFLYGEYLAQKAKCNFRGTKIEIVYTKEIATSFGPWKFINVPGLVLKVTTDDIDSNKTWSLISLEKINTLKENSLKLDLTSFKNHLSFKSFVKQRDESFARGGKTTVSRLDTRDRNTKVSNKRAGIEKIFEWETEDEEKK